MLAVCYSLSIVYLLSTQRPDIFFFEHAFELGTEATAGASADGVEDVHDFRALIFVETLNDLIAGLRSNLVCSGQVVNRGVLITNCGDVAAALTVFVEDQIMFIVEHRTFVIIPRLFQELFD